jgi:hypothetical protein
MLESDKKDIKVVMQDITDSMIRISSEKEFIKEAIMAMSEKYELDKKLLKKVAAILYKQNIAEVNAANSDVQELYEDLTA